MSFSAYQNVKMKLYITVIVLRHDKLWNDELWHGIHTCWMTADHCVDGADGGSAVAILNHNLDLCNVDGLKVWVKGLVLVTLKCVLDER